MNGQYVAPAFEASAFNCPHCQAYAMQTRWDLAYPQGHHKQYYAAEISCLYCSHCHDHSYWLCQGNDAVMLHPTVSTTPPPHADMPKEIAKVYREAAAVASNSYRAAAALLRLALQQLMPYLGEAGGNISRDIASLVSKGLPVRIQQALDLCRVVGNESVHPGTIADEDGPALVSSLFSMLNLIVDDRITRPKEIEALYQKLPENKRKAIETRDGITAAAGAESSSSIQRSE
ncbi:DUF4145 domain-containing protein [Stenotrophomonas maltophilia]|uniref:DUF4145 domain-containing protein n=1 Tax=Stenotrophomonas maltophilia TaxID=40324 RepID=UPI001D12A85D|nr:DUF4145 domain-containing protein [Stenotrophomonas maltophilia]UXB27306.1 DUF4145 domain-containing protein [Stenotrophomonas maltophilia]